MIYANNTNKKEVKEAAPPCGFGRSPRFCFPGGFIFIMDIEFVVNGERVKGRTDASMRLIDLLRGDFRLTGVKEGCGAGECGACTVLMDGEPVCSCVTPAVQAHGREIVTIEGLGSGMGEGSFEPDPVQQAFLDNDAFQCGFCTPGMILTAKALLIKNPDPAEEEIRTALAGNVCRCTGYLPILRAVKDATERMREIKGREKPLPRSSKTRVPKRRAKSREIAAPRSLLEVFSLLSLLGGRGEKTAVSFVAGGTDWMLRRRDGAAVLMDLSGVGELRGIAAFPKEIRVGAMETMTAVSGSALLKRGAACLAQAAASVGSWQIRNRATLGGNLANASPAADTPAALAALGASAILVSAEGQRELPVHEVLSGPGATVLRDGELIAAFRVPLPETGTRLSAFVKVGSRSQVSISRLNLAASVLVENEDETAGGGIGPGARVSAARVFMGTLGAAARRCPAAEDALIRALVRKGPAGESEFCEALAAAAEEAIPGRPTLPYKRSAAKALGLDLLARLARLARLGAARAEARR
jgi:carbon-monoxide dehydrogenase small subunit/xanthine dehydrogenase small subunit